MLNLDTKEQIGIQYTVETELPSRYGQSGNGAAKELTAKLIELPHVIDAELVQTTHDALLYTDLVITVETHGDDKMLWDEIEKLLLMKLQTC